MEECKLMYKAVIFDLDGTLVNSLKDLAVATNYALEQHGFKPYPIDDYKYLIGDGMAKLIERAIPNDALTDETFKSVFNGFMDYYREHCLVYTHVYDGMENAVKTLSDMGLKLAVVSNKADDMTNVIVKEFFGDIFMAVAGKREGIPVKPDPTLTLMIMDEIGVKPHECIFIGDSGMDCATAVNSGCYPLGVLWGFRKSDELLKNGAKTLMSNPNEIIPFVKEMLND
ncbi:MAG: HAD family hydrolase [Clostridia bacterium]|nr:HAD family hydrolase [Clostridia bacterium]